MTDFKSHPRKQLEQMAEAGNHILECYRVLQKTEKMWLGTSFKTMTIFMNGIIIQMVLFTIMKPIHNIIIMPILLKNGLRNMVMSTAIFSRFCARKVFQLA